MTVKTPVAGEQVRTPARECSGCGATEFKARRALGKVLFCATCYEREFRKLSCAECGAPARVHRSQESGSCAPCRKTGRLCVLCKQPVPRAALMVEEGAVCKRCRRHFPPFIRAPKRVGHETCGVCRKHRPVAARRADGRPLCKLCVAEDRSSEVRREFESYWVSRVAKGVALARDAIASPWARELLDSFVEHQISRGGAQALALKLPHYTAFVVAIEKNFSSRQDLLSKPLTQAFSNEQLRRWRVVVRYLVEQGCATVPPEQKTESTERRRISALISAAPEFAKVRLEAYAQSLGGGGTGEKVSTWTTRRLNVKAAASLLEFVGRTDVRQSELNAYVRTHRGHRNCLSRYIRFVNSASEELELPKPKRPRSRVLEQRTSHLKEVERLLVELNSVDADESASRAAFVGLLVALTGIPAQHVLQLHRTCFVEEEGNWSAKFDDAFVALPGEVSAAVTAYFRQRDDGAQSIFAFPGTVPSSSAHSTSVFYHWKKWGLSAARLGVQARLAVASRNHTAAPS